MFRVHHRNQDLSISNTVRHYFSTVFIQACHDFRALITVGWEVLCTAKVGAIWSCGGIMWREYSLFDILWFDLCLMLHHQTRSLDLCGWMDLWCSIRRSIFLVCFFLVCLIDVASFRPILDRSFGLMDATIVRVDGCNDLWYGTVDLFGLLTKTIKYKCRFNQI